MRLRPGGLLSYISKADNPDVGPVDEGRTSRVRPYDAITLDTNIFRQNGYNLQAGLLAQLSQFKQASARFVLSEIVFQEVRRHMLERAADARDKLVRVHRAAVQTGLLDAVAAAAIESQTQTAITPAEATDRRLASFIKATGAEIVPAVAANLNAVLSRYYAAAPPFDPTGAKRHEFPDAIALLSLEAWAKKEGLNLIAISADRGWVEYGEQSECVRVESDLAVALASFQNQQARTAQLVTDLLLSGSKDPESTFTTQVEEHLAGVMLELELRARATSEEDFESGAVTLEYMGFEFLSPQEVEVTIVRTATNKIHFTAWARIDVYAKCRFTFRGFDPEEGTDFTISDEVLSQNDRFESRLLIEVRFVDSAVFVEAVDILDPPEAIDFEYVESSDRYQARRS